MRCWDQFSEEHVQRLIREAEAAQNPGALDTPTNFNEWIALGATEFTETKEEEAVQSSAPAQCQCTREDRSPEVPAGGKLCLHHTTTTGRLGCSNQPDSRLKLPPKWSLLVLAIKTNTKEHESTPASKKAKRNLESLPASQPTILGRPRLLGRDTACCLPPAFLRYRKSVWNKPCTFVRMFWLVFWTRPKLCICASN